MIGHFIIKKQPNMQPLRARRENNFWDQEQMDEKY